MKKKALLSLLLASAFTVAIAAGCSNNDKDKDTENNNTDNNNNSNENNNNTVTPVQLAAPHITIDEKVISWTAVENATGYDVYEGATVVSAAQTTLSYTINKTEAGEYTYTVKAVSTDEKYTVSAASNAVKYTVTATPPPTPPTPPSDEDTSVKLEGKIYLVGDSTVCSFSDNYYLPRYGYGTQLYNYLNCDQTRIVNLALSGRSSLSYLTESNYTTLKNSIGKGDYLIIGFGHNDQKADIYTNPNGDKATAGSFQYTLYENYIKLAAEKEATPILCTPIVRANESNNYSGSSGHIVGQVAAGKPGGDYAQAIRDLGQDADVDVIDLTAITKADYIALGYEKAVDYHAFTTAKWTDATKTEKKRSGVDTTHTNLYGAKMNAYHIASELLKLTDNPLNKHVKTNIVKPTYEENYPASINEGFTIPDYKPFDSTMKSSLWSDITAEGWYGSVFGDLGGNDKVKTDNFTMIQISEDSFKVGNTSGHGKITGSSEGIATIFRQVGYNANFEITATVSIDNYNDANNQSGFGIMLRDDMYIDKNDKSILSNYVAAGCYGMSSSANVCYYRVDSALKNSSNTGKNIDTTATHTLSLKRSGTTVTVTFDSYTYTTVADFDLRGVDSDYMYICLYATRGTVVTFSDINYNYIGEIQA